MKSFYSAFFCLIALFLYSEQLQVDVGAEAAILINADNGAILYEKNAYKQMNPASVTKIGTLLYTLKKKKDALDTLITVEAEAVVSVTSEAKRKSKYTLPAYYQESDGTHMLLKKGEVLTFKTLLEGLMLMSGNDAANMIALFVSGTIPQFMNELNTFLKEEIKCQATHFDNPHGLYYPTHLTTAYDLSLMTKEALKDDLFREIVSQPRFFRPKTNLQKATTYLQGNLLLRPGKYYYPKAIGVKTGYHSNARHNFVGAATLDGRTLIVVLLKNQERKKMFEDAIKLFDAAFNQPKVQQTFFSKGEQTFALNFPKGDSVLHSYLKNDVTYEYVPAENPQIKTLLVWDALRLPIQQDQQVGEIQLLYEGQLLEKKPLFASHAVQFRWPYSWLGTLQSMIFTYPVLFAILIMTTISSGIFAIFLLVRRT